MGDEGVESGSRRGTVIANVRRRFAASQRLRLVRMTYQSEPYLFAAMFAWMIITAVAPLAVVVAMGRVITDVRGAAQDGMGSPAGHRLIGSLIVFGICFALSLADGPAQTALKMTVKSRLTFQFQRRLMRAVSDPVGVAHLEDSETLDRLALAQGTLMSYSPADAPMTLAGATTTLIQGALACVYLATFRWWMALVLAIFWIVANIELHKASKSSVRAYTGKANPMRRAGYYNNVATRGDVAKELRIFGLGDWITDRVKTRWTAGMTDAITAGQKGRMANVKVATGGIVIYVGCLLYLAHVTAIGELTIGKVTVLLSMVRLTQSLGGITMDSFAVNWMLSAFPHVDELERSLERKVGDFPGHRDPVGLPMHEIHIESLSFRYPGATEDVFTDLDLLIPAGKATAIVGVNGAGKTTLVKLLARLHEPSNGRIVADGIDIAEFEPGLWQRRLAVVFQDFNHYPLSAELNVGFGAREFIEDHDGLVEAARQAGADEFIGQLPNGWNTILSKSFTDGTDLSGGQWQRIALARALFAARHGAGLLVLDEPTAWLDVRGEAAFYEKFLDITRGLTTLVISHRFSTVRLADQICVIDGGHVIETGTHESLLDHGGTYASMFRLQASRFVDLEQSERSA